MGSSSLLKLSRALHGAADLEAVMTRVRSAVTESSRYNRAYVHLIHPDGKTFEIVGWVLPNEEMVRARMATIDMSSDRLLQMVTVATEPFVIDDLRLNPLADQKQVEFFGNRTCIVIPMFEGDARIGPLVVPTFADQGVMVPTADELDFFIQVASLVGVVIGRLRAEDARKEAERGAATNERMLALGRMAGEIAHDFNNLLLIVQANAGILAEELDANPLNALVGEITAAATRASDLTRQLLAYSRGQVLSRKPLSLAPLLEGLLRSAAKLLPAGVSLDLDVSPQLGVVLGDAGQLERVFLNLLVNARDAVAASGKSTGTIVLAAVAMDIDSEVVAASAEVPAGRYIVISVSDNGVGMDQATQARIFEPFFSTKSTERGTGLGLSVVDGVVRQHDGRVHVYSEPGVGTTFKVYLPRQLSHADEPAESAAPPSVGADLGGTASIVVADDDEAVRRAVERILVRAGYDVRAVASADEALAALGHRGAALLLTDVVLCGTDGVELAKRAHAAHPALRVLFMTGYARGKLSELDLPHLDKPFAANELLRRVHAILASDG